MNDNNKPELVNAQPIVRVYDIGGTEYAVKAVVSKYATEDAAMKIRRLIRNEIARRNNEN
jgi:hypothetical protein